MAGVDKEEETKGGCLLLLKGSDVYVGRTGSRHALYQLSMAMETS
jgi:hypothetical protein